MRLVSGIFLVGIWCGPLAAQDLPADSPLADSKIETFVKNTRNRPPRENLVRALEMFVKEWEVAGNRVALDIGAGAGNETRHLLSQGWDVIAIDPAPVAIAAIQESAASLAAPDSGERVGKLTCETALVQDVELREDSLDLINASFSLPFVPQTEMDDVWRKCTLALKDNGVFTGHFFGPQHEWKDRSGMSFFSVQELFERYFRDSFEIRYLLHERKTVNLAIGGTAYFDVITVIAQKKERRG